MKLFLFASSFGTLILKSWVAVSVFASVLRDSTETRSWWSWYCDGFEWNWNWSESQAGTIRRWVSRASSRASPSTPACRPFTPPAATWRASVTYSRSLNSLSLAARQLEIAIFYTEGGWRASPLLVLPFFHRMIGCFVKWSISSSSWATYVGTFPFWFP